MKNIKKYKPLNLYPAPMWLPVDEPYTEHLEEEKVRLIGKRFTDKLGMKSINEIESKPMVIEPILVIVKREPLAI